MFYAIKVLQERVLAIDAARIVPVPPEWLCIFSLHFSAVLNSSRSLGWWVKNMRTPSMRKTLSTIVYLTDIDVRSLGKRLLWGNTLAVV